MTYSLLLLAFLQNLPPVTPPALELSPLPGGLFKKLGGYRPLGIPLSETKPEAVVKAPQGALRYGTLTFGIHKVAVATSGDKLYVDANGDGDLTNDPAPVWKLDPPRGGNAPTHSGSFRVPLTAEGQSFEGEFGVYETGNADSLGAFADFALEGKIHLGGKTYPAIYSDTTAAWDGTHGDLMIDKDGDGKFHPGYEFFQVGKPFDVSGTTYELRSEAGQPTVVKSNQIVAETTRENSAPTDPNLANGLLPGKVTLPFQVTTMSGKNISFPKSYQGKIVLLDFWATWCGPCMREVPNVVGAYEKYHQQGFEVLGVSLDAEKAEAQIKAVTKARKMPWEQIYDGKYFEARIAKQYGIKAIPATYLVDGDTGQILAVGDGARAEKLGPAIEKALAAKKVNK
jgi:thiol-disulfide isomerase/thioredoxin